MSDDNKNTYAQAGVDIDAGNAAVQGLRGMLHTTYTENVLSDVGSFGGLYDMTGIKIHDRPVLVASTDGVGTKTMVAAEMGMWHGIGMDLVNHCVNDILVQGAEPLFFMDYVASARLEEPILHAIVEGMVEACREAGAAILGGETAEMPGVYHEGSVDVVGTMIGLVERAHLITGEHIQPGDAVIAIPSSGLHTNGFTLARQVLANEDWHAEHPRLRGKSIGQALLEPHRSYLPHIRKLRDADVTIKGMAHITGGGIQGNLPRILPEGCGARMLSAMWQTPRIFEIIAEAGDISPEEMLRVFNMGVGMILVLPPGQATVAVDLLTRQAATLIGEITGDGQIVIV